MARPWLTRDNHDAPRSARTRATARSTVSIAGNAQHNVRPNLDRDNSGGNRKRRCVHRIGIRGERQGNKRWLRRERRWTGQHVHKIAGNASLP